MTAPTQVRRRRLPSASMAGPSTAVLYCRVSTAEQAESGAGLAAQEAALRAEAERRGWAVAAVLRDAGLSGSTLDRPALQEALCLLRTGQAGVLAASKLDRFGRSVSDVAGLLDRARKEQWALVALDVGVDTGTLSGRALAQMLGVFAEMERGFIGQRTRDALAIRRAEGVRLGRPRLLSRDVAGSIRAERATGATYEAIASRLNADGVTTPTGRLWSRALVYKIAQQEAE